MALGIRLSEQLALCATIDPDAYAAATIVTDEIDMAKFSRVLFIILAGTPGTAATLTCTLKGGASSNAGSHSTTVTGKVTTALTQAGTDADKQVLLEVTAEEVAAQSLRYIELSCVLAVEAWDFGVVALGVPADYSNATSLDLATVDEIVA